MFNISTLALQQDLASQTISLKLILKVPQRYRLSEFLLALIMLTKVQLTPLGKLSGTQGDRSNWCYIQMTGKLPDIIEAASYLQALPVQVKVTELQFNSTIFSCNN